MVRNTEGGGALVAGLSRSAGNSWGMLHAQPCILVKQKLAGEDSRENVSTNPKSRFLVSRISDREVLQERALMSADSCYRDRTRDLH